MVNEHDINNMKPGMIVGAKYYSSRDSDIDPAVIAQQIRQKQIKDAVKFDAAKVRMELIDPLAMEGLAKVLDFGARKYAVDNWRGGFNYTRIIGSLERHLNAIKAGEDIDPESGLPHIDHVGCNWMFLSFFMKQRPDLDDRWYTKKKNNDNRPID